MPFIVKATDQKTGIVAWLAAVDTRGLHTLATRQLAETYLSLEDAEAAISDTRHTSLLRISCSQSNPIAESRSKPRNSPLEWRHERIDPQAEEIAPAPACGHDAVRCMRRAISIWPAWRGDCRSDFWILLRDAQAGLGIDSFSTQLTPLSSKLPCRAPKIAFQARTLPGEGTSRSWVAGQFELLSAKGSPAKVAEEGKPASEYHECSSQGDQFPRLNGNAHGRDEDAHE